MQFVCYMVGWANRTKECVHKDDIATQLIHCCFFPSLCPPNRRNPEMNPNPVSLWSDPWKGSRRSSEVNKTRVCMYITAYISLYL